ncbi:type II toxin-antitoxin system RelE/ParE family toxin [Flavobacteriaceae bacterium]|nr:type II toxin-antitoxin system RelE/ParE family toxin [Flavobacteriaceae bacterium]
MRDIIFSKQSQRIINKLLKSDPKLIKLILNKINLLKINPIIPDSKKLKNRQDYRIRVRNYRIIYEFDDNSLYIIIIDKRGQVYKS